MEGAERAGKVRGKDLAVELDREQAIRAAVRLARKGDLVLILGKGHEKTILRKDGPVEFEDMKVARKYIREKVKEQTEREKVREEARNKREVEMQKILKQKQAERKKKALEDESYGNIVE